MMHKKLANILLLTGYKGNRAYVVPRSYGSIHLLTGYAGNDTFIVHKVPTIFLCITPENSWYRGDNNSGITRISNL
jgi:hypothetical protein